MVRKRKTMAEEPVGEIPKEAEAEVKVDIEKIKVAVPENLSSWVPRTSVGRAVMNGEITSIEQILKQGLIIREPEIVDFLLPDLENELILTGGVPGKGGGKKRTGVRITTRMHKSGRKRRLHALIIIGNGNGIIGVGYSSGKDARTAIEKATEVAKLNIRSIRRGCGSWECACKNPHSIPFKVEGKCGSVRVELLPAPRGLGLCVNEEAKKILRLAGVKDLWMKSKGETGSRINFVMAVFDAFGKLNKIKVDKEAVEAVGLKEGVL